MKKSPALCLAVCAALAPLAAGAAGAAEPSAPSLTVYNQNFALVRDVVPLDLKAGLNEIRFADTTAHVETDSVMLRDPAGKVPLQILEQNYRNDPVSQELLLSLNEGKTLDFQVDLGWGQKKVIQGKVIRSGYVMHSQNAMRRYGQQYAMQQAMMSFPGASGPGQPIIEVDGKLQFSLPGQPIFPALADDTILKPALDWKLNIAKPVKLDAELAYITGGMTWDADYNVVAPEKSDLVDITGWVTIDNQSGKTFKDARIKLMAGDVSKIQQGQSFGYAGARSAMLEMADSSSPAVTEKTFDEYHLYTLEHPTTLRDRETKQVEFIRASGVKSQRVYLYDGLKLNQDQRRWGMENIRNNENFGTECNPKVAVVREIKNAEANHLGMPLPKGQVRFYKRGDDGQPEFTGENVIDHTPKDETLRIYTGNAFDLVGERRRTDWKSDSRAHYADESFEITLRNHKQEPVEIRVVEHLYRWYTWDIAKPSDPYVKTAAQVMEFRVQVPPDGEKKITYTAHYTW
ncbi:MAG: hypothetical protein PHQ12_03825 [Chthoniobacteraceae bacterium]|nr:hypothetical protein [Chthoniobacteraceae bacterium]